MLDLLNILYHFRNEFNKLNNTGARMLDSIYHMSQCKRFPTKWYVRPAHNNHETPGRQTKQSNQLSLPHQDDCKTRRDIK